MMAILCSDGQLALNDIIKECITQKWVPLLTYQDKKTENIYVPIFSIQDTAKNFIKRNLPKNWIKACICLSDQEIKTINSLNYKIEHFSFPRKINENPDIRMGFQIIEFDQQPDFICSRF